LVGKNHEKIVKDTSKDVLVLYYADFSEESIHMQPHIKQLAEHAESIEDLLIGHYDVQNNENEGLEIYQYPTLIYYAKDNKEGIVLNNEEVHDFDTARVWLGNSNSAYAAHFVH
jgi:hypothetical protein